MAKDPAFLFYTGDFSTGTQFFTDEQVGKYIRLLMAQHQHGHLSEQQVKFICKSYDNEVMKKFIKDSDGLFYNERLEKEVLRRKAFSESRSNNKKGKVKQEVNSDTLIKNTSKSYDNHMETETKTKDINKGTKKSGFNFKTELLKVCENETLINDWLLVRKNKNATNSKTAYELFVLEVEKSNMTYESVLKMCVEKDWKGFKASWIMSAEPKQKSYKKFKAAANG